MPEPLAFLNGQWIPASAATIPVGDAGFVQGATVAEQLRTFRGKIFHLDDHLARLAHSLKIVGIDIGLSPDRLAETAQELVAHNHALLDEGDDLGLSIFATPGAYPAYAACEKTEPDDSPNLPSPTLCLHTYPLPFRLWARKYRAGQVLATTDVQQVPSACWPANLKCRSRMHYYLADRRAAAIEPGARALMLDAEGYVTEASTANVLIHTPTEGLVSPWAQKILPGISLSTVVELARRLGIVWTERDLTVGDVASAGEVLLTSTPLCLLPVTRLNGQPIGDGVPGEIFGRLLTAWSRLVGLEIAEQAEQFSWRTAS
jgi:branched-subunit amino acid aminotransferase/4-amino-4-deoxychorismate lyase